MYHTTGLTREQVEDVAADVAARHPGLAITARSRGGNQALTFFRRVHLAICYLRLNTCQAALGDFFATSQSTVSRVVDTFTAAIVDALGHLVPTGDDLDPAEQLIVDGTLLPCWSWRDHHELYSGKHRTTGHNVQVAVRANGTLMWVSDPLPGSTHDSRALRESGVLETIPEGALWSYIGDKGYLGLGMLTPQRKPYLGELTDNEKENNKTINSTRVIVEQSIANLKTWRILHTDYRRPLHTFAKTLTAVLALEFYRASAAPL